MRISVILAHPNAGSFNHAIAWAAVDELKAYGHEVLSHDLYKERFDPLLPSREIPQDGPWPTAITKHCREIGEAEGIVIVHPNWSVKGVGPREVFDIT